MPKKPGVAGLRRRPDRVYSAFAELLGLPYIAVMPGESDPGRVAAVQQYGGRCHFVTPPLAIYDEARRLAGHYLDQFSRAERAMDWRADSLASSPRSSTSSCRSWK